MIVFPLGRVSVSLNFEKFIVKSNYFLVLLLELIPTIVSFMEEKPSWLSNGQLTVAQILNLLVEGAATLYTLKGRKLFKFFEKILKEIW